MTIPNLIFINVHRKTYEEKVVRVHFRTFRYSVWDGGYEIVRVRLDCIKTFEDHLIRFTDGTELDDLKETAKQIENIIKKISTSWKAIK